MNNCPYCEHKDLEIERLKLEIERLNNKMEHIKAIIEDALRVINKIIKWAKEILAHDSGIPRGNWAYAKGAYKVAMEVIARLEYVYKEVLKC